MFRYILREVKRAFKSKMAQVTAICLVAICLVANLAVKAFTLVYGSDIDGVMGSNVLSFATWCFPIPYLATIVFAHLVFGKDYPDARIKDNITKNLSRTMLYVGKFIAALICALVYLVFAFIVLLLITRVFHSDITAYDISTFVENMITAVPLWIAGVSIGLMCLFLFDTKKKSYIVFFIITLVIPRIIMFFAAEPFSVEPLIIIRKALMSQSFGHIPYAADPERSVPVIIAQGVIYTLISCIVGIVTYNKKEK